MPRPHLILLVDDDQDIREAVSEALREQGHDVMTARDGAEALEMLRHPPLPCLILLDLMMPVMDGRTFLRRRQEAPDLARIPLVVLTAGRRSELAGVEAPVVHKPFELALLQALVRQFCALAGPT